MSRVFLHYLIKATAIDEIFCKFKNLLENNDYLKEVEIEKTEKNIEIDEDDFLRI